MPRLLLPALCALQRCIAHSARDACCLHFCSCRCSQLLLVASPRRLVSMCGHRSLVARFTWTCCIAWTCRMRTFLLSFTFSACDTSVSPSLCTHSAANQRRRPCHFQVVVPVQSRQASEIQNYDWHQVTRALPCTAHIAACVEPVYCQRWLVRVVTAVSQRQDVAQAF
jgi:hypothetical protein